MDEIMDKSGDLHTHIKHSIVDFHTHTESSFDGSHTFKESVKMAKENGVSIVGITNHHTSSDINQYTDSNGISRTEPFFNVDDVLVISGIEVTCRQLDVLNKANNSTKFHVLLYFTDRNEDSPISRLIKLKLENDRACDYGRVKYVVKNFGFDISDEEIKEYVIKKRKKDKGFQSIGTEELVELVKKYVPDFQILSKKDKHEICAGYNEPERMVLDIYDVIRLTHASGGIAILAHPSRNLDRTDFKKESIQRLIENGIDGFEMIYPFVSDRTNEIIFSCVEQNKDILQNTILYSAGSDFHTKAGHAKIGFVGKEKISTANVTKFVNNMWLLKEARDNGLLSNRTYIDTPNEEEIEKIIEKQKVLYLTANPGSNELKRIELEERKHREAEDKKTMEEQKRKKEAGRKVYESKIRKKRSNGKKPKSKHQINLSSYTYIDDAMLYELFGVECKTKTGKPQEQQEKSRRKQKPRVYSSMADSVASAKIDIEPEELCGEDELSGERD